MHIRITFTTVALVLGISFAVTATAATPTPSPRPRATPTKPQPTPVRQDDTLPGKVAPGASASTGATTAPQNPGRTTSQPVAKEDKQPKPQILLPDLAITNANQTSQDFFVVRIKNAGNADAAATTLSGAVSVPKGGTFPAGMLPFSVPVPPIAAGKLTDVNVKTNKTHKGNVISFNVNPKQAFKESNYNNNSKILTANPAYP